MKCGLRANEWVTKVCEVIGGKGGGKEQQAQAVCENIELLEKSIEVANEFAQLTLERKSRV